MLKLEQRESEEQEQKYEEYDGADDDNDEEEDEDEDDEEEEKEEEGKFRQFKVCDVDAELHSERAFHGVDLCYAITRYHSRLYSIVL